MSRLRLIGEDARTFLEYDETELSDTNKASISKAHEIYLEACKSDPLNVD